MTWYTMKEDARRWSERGDMYVKEIDRAALEGLLIGLVVGFVFGAVLFGKWF